MRKSEMLESSKSINDQAMRTGFFDKFEGILENYSEYIKGLSLTCDFSQVLAKYGKKFALIREYENEFFIGEQEKVNYGNKIGNLRLIYGNTETADDYIKIFDRTMCLINSYIRIESLGKLFNENYFNLEWNLFMEMNFDKNEKKIYRDHFIHQVRDAYLGYVLLAEAGLYKNVCKTVKKEDNTEFARYIRLHAKKEAEYRYIYKMKFYKDIGFFNSRDDIQEKLGKLENVILEEIIFKAWFVAALFHDIGYPIAHYYKFSVNIDRFMPQIRTLNTHSRKDFVELATILSESYLFKTVPVGEIEKLYDKNDHGALSAICFLLHFYSTGTVNRLSYSERCIVELAAEAMYKHTRKYSIQEDDCDSGHARIYFHKEPLAYLLRVCDDLQEWERIYFEIDSNSNILICNKCKTPALKQDIENDSRGEAGHESQNSEKPVFYKCRCKGENNTYERITTFNYRKINLVSLCNSLDIKQERDDNKNIDKLVIGINYDLYKQLEVLLVSPSFAAYRIKELEKVKKLFHMQACFPDVELAYRLSYNPIELKCLILKEYVSRNEKKEPQSHLYQDYFKTFVDEIYMSSSVKEEVTKRLQSFYLPLAFDNLNDFNNQVQVKEWYKNNKYLGELVDDLIKNSFDKERYDKYKVENKNYTDHILWVVKKYLEDKAYSAELDFYTDLYLFKFINDKLRKT